ncbi:MAG: right-handed parallel beta-helix repeat-containing protein [Methanophagales archaeon]|nr:right-handed parallel beta-helix repeat-containing protein [Methanophagales archaeon]
MKKRYVIVPIVILAMLVLAAFSTPTTAQGCLDDIKTRDCAVTSSGFTNGTITNGSVKVLENRTGPCNQNWTITLPPGDVVVAYVHWHRWGACPNNNPTAEFWNGNGQHQSISIPDSLCSAGNNENRGVWYSGFSPDNGNHHYYWRVNATPGTNTFRATGCYDTSGEHCDDRWFFAVINQTDTANITHSGVWWHNYGYRDIRQNSPTDPYTTWFYNASIGPVSDHSYTLWVAQSHYGGGTIDIYLNNCHLGTFSAPSGTFPLSLKEYNVPNTCIETDGSQTATWDLSGSDDYFYGYFATLAEKAVLNLPDLVVEDIMFPEVMNPGIGYTIEARIKNQGNASSGTFNVSLEVDGSPYGNKVTGVGPLSAGANTTVSFTGVSLSGGCHNFTVVADCNNDTYEGAPGETNNARTEYYQVGNVIVVHNNNQLTSHPDFINRGGIYYLENKTITNCVGCGITIENTTLPVVIQNCTVHDCNYEQRNPGWNQYKAGICLRNVTNVTIGGYRNTIVNNTNAGIRVQNSTHVDIRDNYISNNTKYGIYVYPDQLVKPPYPEYVKYITITNNTVIGNQEGIDLAEAFNCTVNDNTVKDNTKYGVYVCGNYSCIYNNTIVNNSVYGMNLFNASHNIIFWNDFIDNNKTNPQYPEHQAYDMWKHQPGLNPHNHWNSTISDFVYKHDGTPDPPNDYPNVSYMGNYWDNGTCGDTNNNGICDSAYKIDGATAPNDYYPLKYSWRNTYKLMCGDVDASPDVDVSDAMGLDDYVAHGTPLASRWAGDVDCSGEVDVVDTIKVDDYVAHGGSLNCCYCCGRC